MNHLIIFVNHHLRTCNACQCQRWSGENKQYWCKLGLKSELFSLKAKLFQGYRVLLSRWFIFLTAIKNMKISFRNLIQRQYCDIINIGPTSVMKHDY